MFFIKRINTKKAQRLERPLPLDPETGLYSRNFFLFRLKEERERSKRTGRPFSLLVADVDGVSTALNGKVKRMGGGIFLRPLIGLGREFGSNGTHDGDCFPSTGAR